MIMVLSKQETAPYGAFTIDTTSHSKTWSRGLSPFVLGPVELFNGYTAKCVENAWQYSKVYSKHVGADGEPNADWWKWAKLGWAQNHAVRYPMSKYQTPLYSYWNGKHFDYLMARRWIYLPLYWNAVLQTSAFARLVDVCLANPFVVLYDFDSYNYQAFGKSLEDVLNDPLRKMGHAFVLAMMLESIGIK